MCIKLFLFLGERYVNTLPLRSSLKSDGKDAHETIHRIDVSVMTERESAGNAEEGSFYIWLHGSGTLQVISKVWQRERQPEERA